MMPVHSIGIVTSRDRLVVDIDVEILTHRISQLLDQRIDADEFRARHLRPGDKLEVEKVRDQLAKDGDPNKHILKYLYRPFDHRSLFYFDPLIERSRRAVMQHMLHPNLALVCKRQTTDPIDGNYFFCTKSMVADGLFAADNKGRDTTFPLYTYSKHSSSEGVQMTIDEFSPWPAGLNGRRPNLAPEFVEVLEQRLGLAFISDGRGDLQKDCGPEDVFHYVYALLYSPSYRERYAEFLRIDFPRIPIPVRKDLFATLVQLGTDLVALHLMDGSYLGTTWARAGQSSPVAELDTSYPIRGSNVVGKRYPQVVTLPPGADSSVCRVQINEQQYFEGIDTEVWEFRIGGYQVCDKWLKDRRGRTLTYDDLEHFQRIVATLRETIRIMAEIDTAIPGWPLE